MCLLARLALRLGPAVRAKAVQRRVLGFGAGIAVDQVQRRDRHVEFVAAGVFEHQIFGLDAARVELLQTDETTDAVLHRSEEHTSELQSLMRISYAVFCLKKK